MDWLLGNFCHQLILESSHLTSLCLTFSFLKWKRWLSTFIRGSVTSQKIWIEYQDTERVKMCPWSLKQRQEPEGRQGWGWPTGGVSDGLEKQKPRKEAAQLNWETGGNWRAGCLTCDWGSGAVLTVMDGWECVAVEERRCFLCRAQGTKWLR